MFWICLAILAVGVIAAIAVGDSGSLGGLSGDAIASMAALLALLMCFGGGMLSRAEERPSKMARDLVIWLGLILLLVAGYNLRDKIGFSSTTRPEPPPRSSSLPVQSDQPRTKASIRIRKRRDGRFGTRARVEGTPVQVLIDPGATTVMLTSSDAHSAGIRVGSEDYTTVVATAGGVTKAASVRLKSIKIGPLVVNNVEALVAQPGSLSESLLGMNFIERLESFEMTNRHVTLGT